MQPPIFAMPPVGSMAQQYLHLARMFRNAAMALPQYVNGEQNWPAYALLLHASELALKAYCHRAVELGQTAERAGNHDLGAWYRIAIKYGLPADQGLMDEIDALTVLHRDHYARYPDSRSTPIPDLSSICDDVVDWLINVTTRSVNS